MSSPTHPFEVVIAGAGVAGLEAALALRSLAGDRVAITLLAAEPDFTYRPLRVREPFAGARAHVYALEDLAREIGAALVMDAFASLDAARHVVHTGSGQELRYDALLLALGARRRARFRHAVTLDDGQLDEQLHGLIQDLEGGYAHKVAFLSPSRAVWPLPLYELALMTARRAWDMDEDVAVSLITPESAPLEVFGDTASAAVRTLLEENGIAFYSSPHCETPAHGQVALAPGGHRLYVQRMVALPQLYGPSSPGVPKHDRDGFIPIDPYCRVEGLDGVFAAGDATNFAIKHGGVAAQQADVAAEGIAALAGAAVVPRKLHAVLHGQLLGGRRPLYLSAEVTGTRGSCSQVADEPSWSPATKIDARYLAPFLQARDAAAVT